MPFQRVYRFLLRLFPADYRAFFASEMEEAFARAYHEHRALGRAAAIRFATAELAGLATSAVREWTAKLTSNPWVRARSFPDLRLMRPAGVTREAWFGA